MPTMTHLYNFQEMFNKHNEANFEAISKKAKELTERKERIRASISSLQTQARNIIPNFLKKIGTSVDDTTRNFIYYKGQKTVEELIKLIQSAKYNFDQNLESIDFFDPNNNGELMKFSPFSEEFYSVEKNLWAFKDEMRELKKTLKALITKKGLEQIAFFRERAEFLISQFEALGIYKEVLASGIGKLRFDLASFYIATSYNQEKQVAECTLISLFDGVAHKDKPFILFYPSNLRKTDCERYSRGASLIQEVYSKRLFEYIIPMLKALVGNIEIKYPFYTLDRELLRTFECIIEIHLAKQ